MGLKRPEAHACWGVRPCIRKHACTHTDLHTDIRTQAYRQTCKQVSFSVYAKKLLWHRRKLPTNLADVNTRKYTLITPHTIHFACNIQVSAQPSLHHCNIASPVLGNRLYACWYSWEWMHTRHTDAIRHNKESVDNAAPSDAFRWGLIFEGKITLMFWLQRWMPFKVLFI